MRIALLPLALLFGFLGYREARKGAEQFGHDLWNIPPLVWGVTTAASVVLGAVLLYLARKQAAKAAAKAPAPSRFVI